MLHTGLGELTTSHFLSSPANAGVAARPHMLRKHSAHGLAVVSTGLTVAQPGLGLVLTHYSLAPAGRAVTQSPVCEHLHCFDFLVIINSNKFIFL